MIPSEQPVVEENALQIMEKIIDCGILESSPLGWRVARTRTVNDVSDDGWNTEDDDVELQAAILSCGILEASLHCRTEDKCPRASPKKKVVKPKADRGGTNQKQVFAMQEVESLTQILQPNRGKCTVHATMDPILEEPLVIQQGDNSPRNIHAAPVKWRGAKSYQDPTSDQRYDEGTTIDEDTCTELQAAIAACGILNDGEAANGRKVTLCKQPNEAKRQWGRPTTRPVRQQDKHRFINPYRPHMGERPHQYAGNGLLDEEGMTADVNITELQAAIAACGILDDGAIAHGRNAAVEKQRNGTKRQWGRPKKKWVRQQDNRDIEAMHINGQGEAQNRINGGGGQVLHASIRAVPVRPVKPPNTAKRQRGRPKKRATRQKQNSRSIKIPSWWNIESVYSGNIDIDGENETQTRTIDAQLQDADAITPDKNDRGAIAIHTVMTIEEDVVDGCADTEPRHGSECPEGLSGRRAFSAMVVIMSQGGHDHVPDDNTMEGNHENKAGESEHHNSVGYDADDDYRPTSMPPHEDTRSISPQRVHTPPMILSPEDIASQAMARPGRWMDVVENIPTLRVDTWLDSQVANYYLAHAWYDRLGRVKVRFVDMFAAGGTTQWTDEELELFRMDHFVPSDACSVLEQALSFGLDDHGDLPLQSFHIPCGHILRIAMLKVVAGRIKKSCSDYLMLRDELQADMWHHIYLSDDDIHAIETGQHQARCVTMLHALYVASATCENCHRSPALQVIQTPTSTNRHVEGDYTHYSTSDIDEEGDNEADNQFPGDMVSDTRKANLLKLLKSNKELAGSRDRNAISPHAVGTHIPVAPDENPELGNTADSQRSAFTRASRKRVSTWSQGVMERFPRPTTAVPLPAYMGRRWLMDDRTFDDYEGGPTIEMLMAPVDVQPTMVYHSVGMEMSAGWTAWVDHGYRIRPSSFQMFYQCRPIVTMDYIMPIGTTELYDPSNQVPDHVTGRYSLDRSGSNNNVDVNDVICMSASEMIRLAQDDPPLDRHSVSGHEIFLCGRTSFSDGAKYICVDLERDAVDVDERDIEVSVDIDSIIWVTSEFRIKGTIGIYMTPLFQSRPGIFKHNHTSIDILIPQSEEDSNAPGGRTEWLSKRFNMSAIPHICIGRISSASSILNIYLMFPRMIHQHPVNGRSITLIPQDIVHIFYDMVLLPSISHSSDVSWEPYLKQTLEEARYKNRGAAGRSGGRGAPKTIPLSNDDFIKVQKRMHEIIADGLKQLSMYGSCFFVLEGKGIKLLTKDGQRDLDWNHMQDRTHGELLVDVGVSFTPCELTVPMVGVWRLDALEASFGAGGYKQGEMHHHNTLSQYGAIQAEMQQERAHQTHVAFRSAYNLYYEAVRTTSNEVSFAADSDAYKLSPSYMVECSEITKILTGCKRKTYGVWDEYRVEEYVRSQPILWIPSKVWFEFITRRVREIQRTQIAIVKKNPPNLGVLTGILNHMLRATTSTPIVFDSHVRESLALINYKTVLETAGMLFLQEFDISSTTCLDEVQQVDDVHVLALMGVNAKAQRDRAIGKAVECRDVDSEPEEFPIGRTPSWRRLKAAIENIPAVIMRHWTWPAMLSNTSLSVERIFIMFTRQIWLMPIDGVFKGIRPYPTSLQDAMRCWTVTSVDDTLASVTFEACNVGIQNRVGITPAKKDGSQWDQMWKGEGYIAAYHQILGEMEETRRSALRNELREVFSNLHCLPASSGAQVWKVRQSAAVFVTNPVFYKMDCLRNPDNNRTRQTTIHRPIKILKGKRVFAADLIDSTHFDSRGNIKLQTDRQKRRSLMKKITMTNKNKRMPPPPRARKIRPFPLAREKELNDTLRVALTT
ncbi:hypothetical protein DFJ58DRAFT_725189 [Suillus subalutaceus]|uniref:uncharacterized protein n=1 Tax=Suillus subalutaceus TaxID=48586 RepID=UPI001B874092|nr:uncharacterized protein DFJ58DRAFT_725189 [Suillus subalutaceus]KAG1863287.1 hypothetical protein DFJ58DRAFT_725189 [Suillus subalutaceus]